MNKDQMVSYEMKGIPLRESMGQFYEDALISAAKTAARQGLDEETCARLDAMEEAEKMLIERVKSAIVALNTTAIEATNVVGAVLQREARSLEEVLHKYLEIRGE